MKRHETSTDSAPKLNYLPNQGFVGRTPLTVPNYLFDARIPGEPYSFSRSVVDVLKTRSVAEQYTRRKQLTKFLSTRGMTFARRTTNGRYVTFPVPCAPTPIPLPKSLFDAIERSAQMLVASLRLVLQDIYGAERPEESRFIKSLPQDIRKQFLHSIKTSPHYFPQLHHPGMSEYPFFEIVGLDLVLAEDLPQYSDDPLRDLPFRVLELNAGSPSGAANNHHILEGLSELDHEILKELGPVIANDHFSVLGDAFRSLGQYWTQDPAGIAIVLPPGGTNGATPEIHELARRSGLVYAEASQLYCSPTNGKLHIRAADGNDPVVTSIYSRINADSALFSPSNRLTLRDPESGRPIFLLDPLARRRTPLADIEGKPIPLESDYAIPGLLEAVLARRVFLGGLNRLLDNKLMLAPLSDLAPNVFAEELTALGLKPDCTPRLRPPRTLPSTPASVEIVKAQPDNWVVKAANLSGGQGIYILQSLSHTDKQKVLAMLALRPQDYAIQELVHIGRIPVPVRGQQGHHYANLTTDLRMWTLFGAGANWQRPRLTHNALVRTAPQEKGPLSSMVNTSLGGGYASFVVVDDRDAAAIQVLAEKFSPSLTPIQTRILPAFVGAQIVQIARITHTLHTHADGQGSWHRSQWLIESLRRQCAEVASYLDSRCVEIAHKLCEVIRCNIWEQTHGVILGKHQRLRAQAMGLLLEQSETMSPETLSTVTNLHLWKPLAEEQPDSIVTNEETILKQLTQTGAISLQLSGVLRRLARLRLPRRRISDNQREEILRGIEEFSATAEAHLNQAQPTAALASLFAKVTSLTDLSWDETSLNIRGCHPVTINSGTEHRSLHDFPYASLYEVHSGENLAESDLVAAELKTARKCWLKRKNDLMGSAHDASQPEAWDSLRREHFANFPFLADLQRLIDDPTATASPSAVLERLCLLPYAHFNLHRAAANLHVSVADLFASDLKPHHIALLSTQQRRQHSLTPGVDGECFIRKPLSRSLLSDGEILLWIAQETSPLVAAYTIGHELIHAHQLETTLTAERDARKGGPLPYSIFLNFFANLFNESLDSLRAQTADSLAGRHTFFGFADLLPLAATSRRIADLRRAANTNPADWNNELTRGGSLWGLATNPSLPIRAKALREIFPAWENAKNIRFIKDLGLSCSLCEFKAALPTATAAQLRSAIPILESAINQPRPNEKVLRTIASHQYYGVSFPQGSLTLEAPLQAIALGGTYNQTQQQQQQ